MKNIRLFTLISYLKGLYFYTPIYALYLIEGNVSLATIIVSGSIYSIAVFVSEIPTGMFADKYGQKTSLLIGYVIEAFSVGILLIHPSAQLFLILSFIRGFGESFVSGSEEALLYESVKRIDRLDFKKVYSRFLSNGQIGFLISTGIAGFSYQHFGEGIFPYLFSMSTVSFLIVSTLAIFLKNHKADIFDGTQGSGMFTVVKESLLLIRNDTVVRTLAIIGTLTLSGEYFIQDVYQSYFVLHHVPEVWFGAVLAFGTLFNIIALRYVYLFERYVKFSSIIFGVNALLGGAYICMALTVNPIFLVGLYIVMGGLFNIQQPIISDYVNKQTKSEIRTTVLSGISFSRRFVQIFVTVGLSFSVAILGIERSLVIQGAYLLAGALLSYIVITKTGQFLFTKTERRPMVLPVVIEV